MNCFSSLIINRRGLFILGKSTKDHFIHHSQSQSLDSIITKKGDPVVGGFYVKADHYISVYSTYNFLLIILAPKYLVFCLLHYICGCMTQYKKGLVDLNNLWSFPLHIIHVAIETLKSFINTTLFPLIIY